MITEKELKHLDGLYRAALKAAVEYGAVSSGGMPYCKKHYEDEYDKADRRYLDYLLTLTQGVSSIEREDESRRVRY